MKVKFILVVLLSIFSLLSKAQKVNCEIDFDEPEEINNFWVSLDLVSTDINYYAIMPLCIGLRANYDIKDILNINCNLKKSYYSLEQLLETEKIPSYHSYEFGGAFYFYSGIKEKNTKFTLESYTSGDYRYEKYVMLPAKVKIMKGIRGGIIQTTAPIKINSLVDENNSYAKQYLKYSNFSMYLGLQFVGAHNTGIRVEDYGGRGRFDYNLLAFDVMFGGGNFSNKVENKTENIYVKGDNGTVMSLKDAINNAIGFRISYQKFKTINTISSSIRMDFGFYPGPSSDKIQLGLLGGKISGRLFLNISWGITFQKKMK